MAVHNPAITVPPVQQPEPSKGERTRERLLDLAYEAVIRKGFAATCIEELVEAAGITKSGFFYHFRDKNDLAQQLLERYMAKNVAVTEQLTERARDLNSDPLHGYLVFLKFYAEFMDEVAREEPGCLIATVAFQEQAFTADVRSVNAEIVRRWREGAVDWLERIARVYPPRPGVDFDAMADSFIALGIGSLAIAKAVKDPGVAGRLVLGYRETVRQTFAAA